MLTKLAASVSVSSTLFSKYGHFWLQKFEMVTVKMLKSRLQNVTPQTNVWRHGDYVHYFLHSISRAKRRFWNALQHVRWSQALSRVVVITRSQNARSCAQWNQAVSWLVPPSLSKQMSLRFKHQKTKMIEESLCSQRSVEWTQLIAGITDAASSILEKIKILVKTTAVLWQCSFHQARLECVPAPLQLLEAI